MANLYKGTDTETTLVTNDTKFDKTKPTFFIIHGWIEDSTKEEYPEMTRDLYLETQGNIILVDYRELSHEFYTCAWIMVIDVGEYLTQFVLERIQNGDMHQNNIHIIGHSLGAEIGGYVGRKVKDKTNIKIKRISALDTAGPMFSFLVLPLPFISLTAKDAEVVDAIHTSMFMGTLRRVGKVDFFVRGIFGLPTLSAPCGIFSLICNHSLSKFLFRESIRSCGIIASNWIYWSDKIVYGFHMPLNASGIYNFSPNAKPPYGTGNITCAN